MIEVWAEGYACTGERASAIFLGEYACQNFDAAVEEMSEKKGIKVSKRGKRWRTEFGCRLFAGEKAARKGFG